MATKEASKTDSGLAAQCAAIASVGAATIHLFVTPMHWRDWVPSGLFFASVAVLQLLWGVQTWRKPTAWMFASGIAVNVGLIGLWVTTRTSGAPFGPNAGVPEAVEAAGICAVLLEIYIVMGAAWSWSQRERSEPVSAVGNVLVLASANAVIAIAVMIGLASSLSGHHHHHDIGVAEAPARHHPSHVVTPQAPAPVEAAPVTDMALHAEGHDHHD